MLIFYRVISVIISVVAMLLAFSLLMSLPLIFSSPLNMLSGFLIISIVLYTWFSSRFSREVLQKRKPVKHKLRDWVRVNGIVAMIYSLLMIFVTTLLLFNPALTAELVKNLPSEIPVQETDLMRLFLFVLIYGVVLLTHILLTFFYLKKYREFFKADIS